PTDIALVATFFDPRFKHFNWATSVERNRAQNLVKTLYDKLKINLAIPDDNEENLLEASSTQAETDDDEERSTDFKFVQLNLKIIVNETRKLFSLVVTEEYKAKIVL
ncbi:16996_t:CDS:2, partial [Dentiscutata heterogama]